RGAALGEGPHPPLVVVVEAERDVPVRAHREIEVPEHPDHRALLHLRGEEEIDGSRGAHPERDLALARGALLPFAALAALGAEGGEIEVRGDAQDEAVALLALGAEVDVRVVAALDARTGVELDVAEADAG